jgi:hypothetical protein
MQISAENFKRILRKSKKRRLLTKEEKKLYKIWMMAEAFKKNNLKSYRRLKTLLYYYPNIINNTPINYLIYAIEDETLSKYRYFEVYQGDYSNSVFDAVFAALKERGILAAYVNSANRYIDSDKLKGLLFFETFFNYFNI